MTGRLLDVSIMPFEQTYVCKDESTINMSAMLDSHYDAIQALAGADLIKSNESFGFAMAAPMLDDPEIQLLSEADFWDEPEEFVWFVGGWGPDRDRYIANAIRKMRALLRPDADTGLHFEGSTLDLRFFTQEHFLDKVDSQNEDDTFSWGDFPWGGAAFVYMGRLVLAGAVSCLSEIEDDFVAKLILGGLGKLIVIGDNLLPDD